MFFRLVSRSRDLLDDLNPDVAEQSAAVVGDPAMPATVSQTLVHPGAASREKILLLLVWRGERRAKCVTEPRELNDVFVSCESDSVGH